MIEITAFLHAVSKATDYAEDEVLNIAPNHAKRVAVLTHRLAEGAGWDAERVYALTETAVLHDCALSEYLTDELSASDGEYVSPLHKGRGDHKPTAFLSSGEGGGVIPS